jgi:hypothetical protein
MAKKLREYIVTLKDKCDLDCFYDDMEQECNEACIPKRKVECTNRRPVSRNTHYLLSDAEAKKLCEDDRVLSIELSMEEQGIQYVPQFTQEEIGTWAKNNTPNNNHRNWGLFRTERGNQLTNWGSNGSPLQSGKIFVPKEGRRVDLIMVDGHTNPDHPEFKVNEDGTGQSRILNFNWLQYNPVAPNPIASETYIYPPYTGPDNNHGAHVFGILAGNRNGWARSARLYHMSPYADNPNQGFPQVLWDYIRIFHNIKLKDTELGVKRPTLTNHSYGTILTNNGTPYTLQQLVDNITEISFRGTTLLPPYTTQILKDCGIVPININDANPVLIPVRSSAIDADVEDAINDGVIVVSSAGNSSFKVDVAGGVDYNNSFVLNGFRRFYNRGMSPSAATGAICVGSISSFVDERKASYSNCGPRVDIYAPGDFIQSSVNEQGPNSVQDARNGSFLLEKKSGTSMSGPQVCGVLAGVLEVYPELNQEGVLEYLNNKGSKEGQISDSTDSFLDPISLQGSPNKYLYYYPERRETGQLAPKKDFFIRPASGVLYPRTKKRRRT